MNNFERKLDVLLMLSKSWQSDELFMMTARELAMELAMHNAQGTDPEDMARALGGLQGVLSAQTRWLQDEAARLVATGVASYV
ncbi:MAG TPA: hypothetical protein PK178_14600 [Smithellaceae bacterium]|nr:hypothetical protein [Smithellaceae bacterium]